MMCRMKMRSPHEFRMFVLLCMMLLLRVGPVGVSLHACQFGALVRGRSFRGQEGCRREALLLRALARRRFPGLCSARNVMKPPTDEAILASSTLPRRSGPPQNGPAHHKMAHQQNGPTNSTRGEARRSLYYMKVSKSVQK